MSASQDRSTRPPSQSPLPFHVFTPELLAYMAARDEPETAAAADTAGPWHVEEIPESLWGVYRAGESRWKGSTPTAVFTTKAAAQLTAAILPGTGARRRYKLLPDVVEPLGYPILLNGEPVGHSQYFHEDLVAALNVVDALLTVPRDFAWLLDAIGGVALERVDAIAVARLAGGEP